MKLSRERAGKILYGIGFIWSLAALSLAAMQYFTADMQVGVVDGLLSAAPLAKSRSAEFVTDPAQAKLVRSEVEYGWLSFNSLHGVFVAAVQGARARAVTNILLWLGPVTVFTVLLIRARD